MNIHESKTNYFFRILGEAAAIVLVSCSTYICLLLVYSNPESAPDGVGALGCGGPLAGLIWFIWRLIQGQRSNRIEQQWDQTVRQHKIAEHVVLEPIVLPSFKHKRKRKNDEKRKGIASRPEKEKRKRGLFSSNPFKTVVEWRLPKHLEKKRQDAKAAVFLGGGWLFICLLGTIHYINDWEDWELLDQQGKTQAAPLVEIGKSSCGRGDTCYYAIYNYQNTEHREGIDEEQYRKLSNEATVEIVAAGNISRIAGTRPDFVFYTVLMIVMCCVGLYAFLWGVRTLLKIRSMKKYRR